MWFNWIEPLWHANLNGLLQANLHKRYLFFLLLLFVKCFMFVISEHMFNATAALWSLSPITDVIFLECENKLFCNLLRPIIIQHSHTHLLCLNAGLYFGRRSAKSKPVFDTLRKLKRSNTTTVCVCAPLHMWSYK